MRDGMKALGVILVLGSGVAHAEDGKGDDLPLLPRAQSGHSTTVEAYAVDGAQSKSFVCPAFINGTYTYYSNGSAQMQIVWDPTGMVGDVYTSKVGVGVWEATDHAAGVQIIDVLTSPWDGEPEGYAMGASYVVGAHQFVAVAAYLDENGAWEKCENLVTFETLPPPMEVTQGEEAFVEGGSGSLVFTQTYPLDHDNEYPLFVAEEEYCFELFPGFPMCFGGSATYLQDWTGLATNDGPTWTGATRFFPAGETVSVQPLAFPNDNCKESTEAIEMGWMYVEDLFWGNTWVAFSGFLGNPTARFDIADDGDIYFCTSDVPGEVGDF